MGVTLDTPPAESLAALSSALKDMMPTDAAALESMVGGNQAMSELPHEIQNVGLDALASGGGIKEAETVGWRYLPSALPEAAVEVLSDAAGGNHTFSEINRGPYVEATRETLASARSHPQIEKGEYRVTLLRIPALYVMALWFHATDDGDDLVFVIPPMPQELSTGKAGYSIEEFNAVLQEMAEARAKFDDRPEATPDTAGQG